MISLKDPQWVEAAADPEFRTVLTRRGCIQGWGPCSERAMHGKAWGPGEPLMQWEGGCLGRPPGRGCRSSDSQLCDRGRGTVQAGDTSSNRARNLVAPEVHGGPA